MAGTQEPLEHRGELKPSEFHYLMNKCAEDGEAHRGVVFAPTHDGRIAVWRDYGFSVYSRQCSQGSLKTLSIEEARKEWKRLLAIQKTCRDGFPGQYFHYTKRAMTGVIHPWSQALKR